MWLHDYGNGVLLADIVPIEQDSEVGYEEGMVGRTEVNSKPCLVSKRYGCAVCRLN